MTKPRKTKKKMEKPTFRKIENGMIFTSEYGIAVGLPTEVETMSSAEGGVFIPLGMGKAKGGKYSKVKYDWRMISGSPLPPAEMEEVKESIATSSGTVVASLSNAIAATVSAVTVSCKKCGTLNLESSKFCSNCGSPL